MQARVLVTNNGPHSAFKWAGVIADEIVDGIRVDNLEGEEAEAAERSKPRFKLDIIDAVEAHCHNVMNDERDLLDEHGHKRYAHYDDSSIPHMAHEEHSTHYEGAVQAIIDAAAKYPAYAQAFARDDVRKTIERVVNDHMSHAMRIEHGYHKDSGGKKAWRPPGHPSAR